MERADMEGRSSINMWVGQPQKITHRIQDVVFDQQSVGSNLGRDTCYVKLGRYTCFLLYRPGFRLMIPKSTSGWTVKGGNPVSALGVGGNDLWNKIIVALTSKRPSGLVCLATCIKKKTKSNIHRSQGTENHIHIVPQVGFEPGS